MTENTGSTPGAADDRGATFDQTGGLMDQYEGEDETGRDAAGGDDALGNPLRPGGQDGAVGDVADGEEPHLNPDADGE